MNNLAVKGLIVTIITFLAETLSNNGLPGNTVQWYVLGFTLLGTIVTYVAQSLAIKTTSIAGDINWLDLGKGALVALGNFFSGIGAAYVVGTSIDWKALFISAGTLLIGYLAKQLTAKPPTK